MCPVVFRWGCVSIYSWPTLYIIAILAAIWITSRIDKSLCVGIGYRKIVYLYILTSLASLIGAQLFQWCISSLSPIDASYEGRAYYGGVIVVIFAILLFSRLLCLSTYKLLDISFVALTLGGCIGRIGCLLNGCCRGESSYLPWFAIKYPAIRDIKTFPTLLDLLFGMQKGEYFRSFRHSVYVHPAPIYYSIGFLLIFIFLYSRCKKINKIPGNLFYMWLILHGFLRFLIEFIRDNPPYLYGKLNISGLLSLVGILVGIMALTIRKFVRCKYSSVATIRS